MTPADFADSAARAIAACENKSVKEQAAVLGSDGLLGILAGEDAGGLGLPLGFAVPVVKAGGKALVAFPLIETLLLAGHLPATNPLAAELATGQSVATVAWKGSVRLDVEGRATGTVAACRFAGEADVLLVRVDDGGGLLVSRTAPNVKIAGSDAFDAKAETFEIRLENLPVGDDDFLPSEIMTAIDRDALILRAAAILGAAEFCLEAACEHASTRKQFGKPLIANQAIRHHLARHKLAYESANTLSQQAVSTDASLQLARAAFAVAVTGGIGIAEGSIQIHGGMGFTWEVPLHFYLRYIRSMDEQAGSGANLDHLAQDYINSIALGAAA